MQYHAASKALSHSILKGYGLKVSQDPGYASPDGTSAPLDKSSPAIEYATKICYKPLVQGCVESNTSLGLRFQLFTRKVFFQCSGLGCVTSRDIDFLLLIDSLLTRKFADCFLLSPL